MTTFDPHDPKHASSDFLEEPGRYIVQVKEYFRMRSQKGDDGIVAKCEVLLGSQESKEVSRLFMLTGAGTRWFADLLKALSVPVINDIYDDREISQAIGRRPFAAECNFGTQEIKSRPGSYFMEIQEVFPIDAHEQTELRRKGYQSGVQGSIMVERQRKDRREGARQDDVPPPGDDYAPHDGPQQAGRHLPPPGEPPDGGHYPPPPTDDDRHGF